MTKTQTNELTELYSAPKCKVVKTAVNRAIMVVSGTYGTEDYTTGNGEWDE